MILNRIAALPQALQACTKRYQVHAQSCCEALQRMRGVFWQVQEDPFMFRLTQYSDAQKD